MNQRLPSIFGFNDKLVLVTKTDYLKTTRPKKSLEYFINLGSLVLS